jgi:hypothetical protein
VGSTRTPDDGDLWFVAAQFDVSAGRLAASGWAIVVARSRREARLLAQTSMRAEWERRTAEWVPFNAEAFCYSAVERIDPRTVRPIAAHVERTPPDSLKRIPSEGLPENA